MRAFALLFFLLNVAGVLCRDLAFVDLGFLESGAARRNARVAFREKAGNIQTIPRRAATPEPSRVDVGAIFDKYIARLTTPRSAKKAESKFLEGPWKAFKNETTKIANKLLSLFTVVEFPNSRCRAGSSSRTYEGRCYHRTECEGLGGTSLGTCADGYGVCCVFRYTCGGSSGQNCSYFESPDYPDFYPPGGGVLPPPTTSTTTTEEPTTAEPTTEPPATTATTEEPEEVTPDPRKDLFVHHMKPMFREETDDVRSCTFRVRKASEAVRQMRIDFEDLELSGPTDGDCVEERLVISGRNSGTVVPDICGYNTGQHVYVDVSDLSGPLQLTVSANGAERKRFKIRVCQLADSCAASSGCLQYHSGVRGAISSFNYDRSAANARSVPGYFNNLNYAVCIARLPGYCSVTYTNVRDGLEYPFETVNVDEEGTSTTGEGEAGTDATSCPDDYVVVGGTRLCGDRFDAPVTDDGAGPVVVRVRSDGADTGRGFKLFYTQNRCTGGGVGFQ